MTRSALTHVSGSAPVTRAAGSPTATTRILRAVLMASGAIALLSGLSLWTGVAPQVAGVHGLAGILVFLGLLIAAGLAARVGAPQELLGLAVSLDVITIVIAVAQKPLLPGPWHWTIRLLHLGTMVAAMIVGRRLFDAIDGAPPAGDTAGR